jgi:F0F1-type ATP synthase membrane subunit b/b'
MSTSDSERSLAPGLTALPSLDSLPSAGEGYDKDRVREAFDAFRRHASQLQAQLRVLQAARKTADVEPTGHAVRMDALHLIRAAAEFADTLERDAQPASAAQLSRTEQEVRGRQTDLQAREAEVERFRTESERQRAEIVTAAKNEARDLLAKANADATRELREAEARASRLLEQSRHQATELTNAARAEVEQTLEWARAQASAVMARAQDGVEKLLAAAGLGEPAMTEVVKAILGSLEETTDAPSRPAEAIAGGPPPAAPPVSAPPAPAPPVSSPAPSGPPPAYSPPAAPADKEPEPVEGEQDEQEPHS